MAKRKSTYSVCDVEMVLQKRLRTFHTEKGFLSPLHPWLALLIYDRDGGVQGGKKFASCQGRSAGETFLCAKVCVFAAGKKAEGGGNKLALPDRKHQIFKSPKKSASHAFPEKWRGVNISRTRC